MTDQFDLTDDQREIRELARRFTADRITPFAAEWDEKHIFPRDTIKAAAELGFAAIYVSEESGGINLGRLEAALNNMRNAPDWDKDGIPADLDFHRTLAEATQNDYFSMFLGFIAERISSAIKVAFSRAVFGEILETTIQEHVPIYEAIAASDAAAARAAMRAHLVGAAKRLNLEMEIYE